MGADSDSDGHPMDEYLARAAKRPRMHTAAGRGSADGGDGAGHEDGKGKLQVHASPSGDDSYDDLSSGEYADDSHDGSMTSDDADGNELHVNDKEEDPGDDTRELLQPAVEDSKAATPVGAGAEHAGANTRIPGSSNGGGDGQPKSATPTDTKPVGVVLVDDTSEIVRDYEVAKLLRNPRYFDDYADVQTRRCFNCGQIGHAARDCTNQARVKPCYLCAQLGHDGRECPNRLCFRCGRPGHKLRECREQAGAAAEGRPCMRCGRGDCDAAGKGDYFRYEGGCNKAYTPADLSHVRCMSCGDRGHLMCKPAPKETSVPSCYNCGRLGHYGECCPSGTRPHLLAERRGDEERAAAELLEYEMQMEREFEERRKREQQRGYGGGGGGYGDDRYRGGGGHGGGVYDRYRNDGGGGYGQDQRRGGGGGLDVVGGVYGGGYDGGAQAGGYGAAGGRNVQIPWNYESRRDDWRGGVGGDGGGAPRRYSPEPYPRAGGGGGGNQHYEDRRGPRTSRW